MFTLMIPLWFRVVASVIAVLLIHLAAWQYVKTIDVDIIPTFVYGLVIAVHCIQSLVFFCEDEIRTEKKWNPKFQTQEKEE